MDVASGEVIARGLSMPHSPRWYAGRLWVCESGAGALGFIDPDRRQYVPIAEVLGFTRGLDFAGNLAFVGLSQVRECAVFSGVPIVERLAEDRRTGGVCAIDLATGQVVALLRFETGVPEISPVTHEAATMVPQRADAAADAPSVPATARDVVGRRWSFLRRSESQGLETNPARRDNVGGELPHISTTIGTPSPYTTVNT